VSEISLWYLGCIRYRIVYRGEDLLLSRMFCFHLNILFWIVYLCSSNLLEWYGTERSALWVMTAEAWSWSIHFLMLRSIALQIVYTISMYMFVCCLLYLGNCVLVTVRCFKNWMWYLGQTNETFYTILCHCKRSEAGISTAVVADSLWSAVCVKQLNSCRKMKPTLCF